MAGGALLVALMLALLQPGNAAAGLPAICTQYPDLPQCEAPEEGEEDDGDEDDDDEAGAPGGGAGPTGSADGELPFTGYPLTPLLLLFLVLLLAGLTIRAYLAIRDRVRGDSATAGSYTESY